MFTKDEVLWLAGWLVFIVFNGAFNANRIFETTIHDTVNKSVTY